MLRGLIKKMKYILLIFLLIILLTGCIIRKDATLIGYENDRMILVTSDTISYGSNKKGKIGDGYQILYRGKHIVRIKSKL